MVVVVVGDIVGVVVEYVVWCVYEVVLVVYVGVIG